MLCEFVDRDLGIRYREDQRNLTTVSYADPSDLFLNGVMDTRQGTCGNMSMLHVALGWRLGWPVSLACVNHHQVCRFDDGQVTYNIEATQTGIGGFKAPPDAYCIEQYDLSPKAISSGSDLRAITPRELLGIFLGFRGRHMRDTNRRAEAESDYLLARYLFPSNRKLYINATEVSVERSLGRFEIGEKGSASSLADWLNWEYGSLVPIPSHRSNERSMRLPLPEPLEHFSSPAIIIQAMRHDK